MSHWIEETPTKGKFRDRTANLVYFSGSDRPNELPGMYKFWTAFIGYEKQGTKRRSKVDVVPARARASLPKEERFKRMLTDAIIKPNSRAYYRALYKRLKKPLQIRPSNRGEVAWWLNHHTELKKHARFVMHRHGGFKPWP